MHKVFFAITDAINAAHYTFTVYRRHPRRPVALAVEGGDTNVEEISPVRRCVRPCKRAGNCFCFMAFKSTVVVADLANFSARSFVICTHSRQMVPQLGVLSSL